MAHVKIYIKFQHADIVQEQLSCYRRRPLLRFRRSSRQKLNPFVNWPELGGGQLSAAYLTLQSMQRQQQLVSQQQWPSEQQQRPSEQQCRKPLMKIKLLCASEVLVAHLLPKALSAAAATAAPLHEGCLARACPKLI